MNDVIVKTPPHSGVVWDALIQLAGIALLVLLVLAYATGEDYIPHTYMI